MVIRFEFEINTVVLRQLQFGVFVVEQCSHVVVLSQKIPSASSD